MEKEKVANKNTATKTESTIAKQMKEVAALTARLSAVEKAITATGAKATLVVAPDKQATEKSLAKYMRTGDPEVLAYSYQHYLKRTPKKPYPTMKGIQYMLELAAPQFPQAKNARPEQFVDLSFLQDLEAEVFFSEMEKRYR